MMVIQVLAIVVALGLLMFFAYRGFPVIVFAPIFTLLAVRDIRERFNAELHGNVHGKCGELY